MVRFHQIPSSRDVTIPMVLVGIPIGCHWYWQVFVLLGTAIRIGIGIAIHTHILLKSLFSQDHSIIQNTKKMPISFLPYPSSRTPRKSLS